MRFAQILSVMAVVLAFGGVGLAAQTASAICCSAPLCQWEEPPAPCGWCDPNCVEGEEMSVARELVYDEVEGICYETGDTEPVPCDAAEAP
jgi:hypothetical protein